MLITHAFRLLGFPRRPDAATRLAAIDWPALDWTFATSWGGERREIAPGFDLGHEDWNEVRDGATGAPREIDAVDPAYGNKLRLRIYYIEKHGAIRIFAAGEVSNGVWLIFIPNSFAQDEHRDTGAQG